MAPRLTQRRLAALALLVVAVLAVHGCVVRRVADELGAFSSPDALPQRLQARALQAMEIVEPEPRAATSPRPKRRAAPPPVAPVEAVEPAASAAAPVPEPEAEPVAEAASEPVVAPAAAAASAPPFAWPLGTKLTYDLTGNYRGPIHGDAQVEWLRDEDVYQMHLDVSIGPSLTPFMSRKMSSQGRITAEGLRPELYVQETKLAFSAPVRSTVRVESDAVLLANGQRRALLPDLQDTASQFVQLAFRFSTQPGLLTPGAVIAVPIAMPRSVTTMLYDVSEREMLRTSFGEVPVYRLKPRLVARAGTDLAVEMWIAPRYRYLPIRLVIHQDADTFVDMVVKKVPEEAVGDVSSERPGL